MLFDVMHKNKGDSVIIKLWPPCPPHHLQHISDGKINVSFTFPVEILCSFHNH